NQAVRVAHFVQQEQMELTTTLMLIRHGHVPDNDPSSGARLCGWADPPLSPLGEWQVRRLSERLQGEAVAALYTSPLLRTWCTAQALADTLGVPPQARISLREIGCGHVDGWRLADVQHQYSELWQINLAQNDERFRWPGGESYRAFRSRCVRTIRRLATKHQGQRIILVTHTGLITQVLGAMYGVSAARWGAFRVGNASLTEICWHGETGELVRFDDRQHLLLGDLQPSQPSRTVSEAATFA
ncbi:MAG TPA: histidine phosphatase family protein, partial [Chloroflexota bacterium]|nr:histidine phosphatase family protein [Chloroflexota bacterium]